MSYRLAPNHHVALIGDQAIDLDTKADRYRLLGRPAAAALRTIGRDDDHPGIARLIALGIVETGAPLPILPTLVSPTRSAIEMPPCRSGSIAFASVARALAAASWRLRMHGLAATLATASPRIIDEASESDQLISFVQAYVRQRSRLPLRHICLADSLALHGLLSARAWPGSLVIGVRLNPFGAHCWVQTGDMVLNDSCDTVSGFTPILVL